MSIETWNFGTTAGGEPVQGFTITNKNGIEISVIEYGAYLTSCKTPDRNGHISEITLGYNTLSEYETNDGYLGATVGRWANRIKQAEFTLHGTTYKLPKNDGNNHLHGGPQGLSQRVWKSKIIQGDNWQGVACSIVSPTGEEGYPGNLTVTAHYRLTNQNELIFEYVAKTDAITPVNITNHAYFNLNNSLEESPENHIISIDSEAILELDDELIPTGKLVALKDTPYDLMNPKKLAKGPKGGFDSFYILTGQQPAARVCSPSSGRVLTLKTDAPGVQLYTSGQLSPRDLRRGKAYEGAAFCLEPGAYNDAVNNPHFPQSLATPEKPYRQKSVITFSVG